MVLPFIYLGRKAKSAAAAANLKNPGLRVALRLAVADVANVHGKLQWFEFFFVFYSSVF